LKKFISKLKDNIPVYSFIFGIALAIVLYFYAGFHPSTGDSMNPTYEGVTSTFNISRKLYNKEIERFDVVEIEMVYNGKEEKYLKRIVGLPGEKIRYIDGDVYINDVLVENPYVKYKYEGGRDLTYTAITLGENEYFVLGDNQAVEEDKTTSCDSRFFGAVKDNEIVAFCLGGI